MRLARWLVGWSAVLCSTYWVGAVPNPDHPASPTSELEPSDWRSGYVADQRARLVSRDQQLRWQACESLSRHRDLSARLVPELANVLNDPNRHIRESAAKVLESLGPKAWLAVPKLSDMLRSDDVHDRLAAERILAAIGPAAHRAVPGLLRELDSWDINRRVLAAVALGGAGAGSEVDVVPALVCSLSDNSAEVRAAAASALGEFGPKAASAVPALVALVADPNHRVRQAVGAALARTGPDAAALAAPVIRKQLTSAADPVLRMDLAMALADVMHHPDIAFEPCFAVINHPDGSVAAETDAIRGLAQTRSHQAEAIAVLVLTLRDRHPPVAAAAAQALGDLGLPGSKAAAALESMEEARDLTVRAAVQDAMTRIRGKSDGNRRD